MRDTEDYYRAGTFTSGLIPALREFGVAAEDAAQADCALGSGDGEGYVGTFGKHPD